MNTAALTLKDCMGQSVFDFQSDPKAYTQIISFVHAELAKLVSRFKVNGSMSPDEVTECGILICETYQDLTPEDFVLFSRSVRMGFIQSPTGKRYEFEKPYGAVDEPLVMRWMLEYYNAKIDMRENLQKREKEERNALLILPVDQIQKAYRQLEEVKEEAPKEENEDYRMESYKQSLPLLTKQECTDLRDHLRSNAENDLADFIDRFINEKQW